MEPDIAFVASLIGDQARARMLMALMGGKALTATELAIEADITAQTASNHLAKLLKGELVIVRKQGRHKYFQLRNYAVAELIEQLLNISADNIQPKILTGPTDPTLRKSRICYDHLAGEVGVSLFDGLVKRKFISNDPNIALLTDPGEVYFRNLGVDLDSLKKLKRPICKACLDWSERRNHLAGSLGKWILTDLLHREWAVKDLDSRVIRFTESGLSSFLKRYGASFTN